MGGGLNGPVCDASTVSCALLGVLYLAHPQTLHTVQILTVAQCLVQHMCRGSHRSEHGRYVAKYSLAAVNIDRTICLINANNLVRMGIVRRLFFLVIYSREETPDRHESEQ